MRWNLARLYKGFDDPALERDAARLNALIEEAGATLGRGHEDEAALLTEALQQLSEIASLFNRIGNLVMLTLAAEAENERAGAWHDRFLRLEMRINQLSSAMARYVGDVGDLDALTAGAPLLREHAYLLRTFQQEAAHTLDPAIEEAVLGMQMTGGRAWEKLRDLLDATHTVCCVLGEEERVLTLSEARNLAYSADPDVRRAAYEAELASYAKIEVPMAACLNGIKGEALLLAKLRHYDSVLDQSLTQSHISRAVLEAMMTAMREALCDLRRYLRLKAKALGREGALPFYDLFAPVGEAGGAYTLESARDLLVKVLGDFSPRMGQMIARAFEENWIDAFPRAGKQGGAFCSSAHPLGISYVLSNFDGTLGAVSTLAHELGHAYHDQQLFQNKILNSSAPMPLAETASIFNETMLTQTLIAQASDAERLMLLDQELTDATQTIVDILSRYLFETRVLERRADHALSAKELQDIMLDAQREAYADGLDGDFLHPYMWACKSHYYSAELHFYNFPYAFGLLFGKGVYALRERRGDAFVAEYEELLRQSALGDAQEVAARVGIDLTDLNFWRGSLNVIRSSIDQFGELVEGKQAQ